MFDDLKHASVTNMQKKKKSERGHTSATCDIYSTCLMLSGSFFIK